MKELTRKEKEKLYRELAWKEFYEGNLNTKKLNKDEFQLVNRTRKWLKKEPLLIPYYNQKSLKTIDRGEELIGESFYKKNTNTIEKIIS